VARGARQGRDEGCDARGCPSLEGGERVLEWNAEGGGLRCPVELAGERAVMPPADLLERPGRTQAGGDGDPDEVEHVAELVVDRVCAGAGRAADEEVGREERPRRGDRGERR
jgi:hypothetical protein